MAPEVTVYIRTVSNYSAYDATSTKSNGVKIDGFLYPKEKFSHPLGVQRVIFGYKNPSILSPLDSVDVTS